MEKIKILFLADSNSPHTLRWVKSISDLNYEVGIFSIHRINKDLYKDHPQIKLFSLDVSREIQSKSELNVTKLVYLLSVKKIKKVIKEFQPDILHAHYASSYGLLGALSGFHPFIVSLWGGDIFSFPGKSIIHKSILKFVLEKADKILSTSKIMQAEAKKYSNKDITLTPFGIDINRFYPKKVNSLFHSDDIVIGTVKTLEERYGIEYLIKGFHLVKKKFSALPLKLLIVGGGTQLKDLTALTRNLNLQDDAIFTGFVDHDKIQDYHNMLDVYVAVSLEESFGVAVLEASACSKPVIVSNVGGLPEVVDDGVTGFIVDSKNAEAVSEALEKLIYNSHLRTEMGINGRNKVIKEYNWNDSVSKMNYVYREVFQNYETC